MSGHTLYIPGAFQVATLLAVVTHPSHLVHLSSRGFVPLPPRSNLKSFGYSRVASNSTGRSCFARDRERLSKSHSSGFTLLEVMLALAILAMVGISMTMVTGEGVNNTRVIREKTMARWVADNELTTIALEERWPGTRWKKYTVDLANTRWFVQVRSVKTGNDDFRQVNVEVRLAKDDKEPALTRMQMYMEKGASGRQARG